MLEQDVQRWGKCALRRTVRRFSMTKAKISQSAVRNYVEKMGLIVPNGIPEAWRKIIKNLM